MSKDAPFNRELELDRIEALRKSETNTGYYAAGAFAPMLVLINMIPYIVDNTTDCNRKIVLLSILCLGLAGVTLIIYRAFHVNIMRIKIEMYVCEVTEEYELDLFPESWKWVLRLAFLMMIIGYFLMFYFITIALLGN